MKRPDPREENPLQSDFSPASFSSPRSLGKPQDAVPSSHPNGSSPAPDQHHCACKDCDQLRVEAERGRATQETLTFVAALIQNPSLTWQEKSSWLAVALALQAQRPANDPNGAFRVNTGLLARHASLIPPPRKETKRQAAAPGSRDESSLARSSRRSRTPAFSRSTAMTPTGPRAAK
jgi:hypothetical protein